MPPQLVDAMASAIDEMKHWPEKTVRLFHHNDADGLTSAAILIRALRRAGYEVSPFCLEKPYPAVLEKIFTQRGRLIMFADFAGRIAPLISDLNNGRNLVLILDHHKAAASTDDRVHNLDGELFGLKGDRDITASSTCYLFARILDDTNRDLAGLAATGAVADGFFVEGRLFSQNRRVALEAVEQGLMKIDRTEAGEAYFLNTRAGWVPCEKMGADLNTFGAVGYYREGPDMGVRVCLEGISRVSDRMLGRLGDMRDRIFLDQLSRIRRGEIHTAEHIQWVHVDRRFSPMGVKMIGIFLDQIKNSDIVDGKKYLAGFMTIPDRVPGFGSVEMDQVKISMRVTASLAREIQNGNAPGLDTFLPEATDRMGGFSDACHSLAAATTIAPGREALLVAEMEKVLETIQMRSA